MPVAECDALIIAENNIIQLFAVHDSAYRESWYAQGNITHADSEELKFKKSTEAINQTFIKLYMTFSLMMQASEKLQIAYIENSYRPSTQAQDKIDKCKRGCMAYLRLLLDGFVSLAENDPPAFVEFVRRTAACQILFFVLTNAYYLSQGDKANQQAIKKIQTSLQRVCEDLPEDYQGVFDFIWGESASLAALQHSLQRMVREQGWQSALSWLEQQGELLNLNGQPPFLSEFVRTQLTIALVRECLDVTSKPVEVIPFSKAMAEQRYLIDVSCESECVGHGELASLFYGARLFKKIQLQGVIYHLFGQNTKIFLEQSDRVAELFLLTSLHNDLGELTGPEKLFLVSIFKRCVERVEANSSLFHSLKEKDFWALGAKAFYEVFKTSTVTQEMLMSFYKLAPKIIENTLPTNYLILCNELISNLQSYHSVIPFDENETEQSLTLYRELITILTFLSELKNSASRRPDAQKIEHVAKNLSVGINLFDSFTDKSGILEFPTKSKFSFFKNLYPALLQNTVIELFNDSLLTFEGESFQAILPRVKEALLKSYQCLGLPKSKQERLKELLVTREEKRQQMEAAEQSWLAIKEDSTAPKKTVSEQRSHRADWHQEKGSINPELARLLAEEKAQKERQKKEKIQQKAKQKAEQAAREEQEKLKAKRKEAQKASKQAVGYSPLNNPKLMVRRTVLPAAFIAFVDRVLSKTSRSLYLVGGAVTSLYLRRPLESIRDFDCLILGVPLEELCEELNRDPAFHCQAKIVGARPVLKVRLKDGDEVIEIDINSISSPGPDPTKAISDYLKRVDFKLSALYAKLTDENLFIQGMRGAIKSIDEKRIELIEKQGQCFADDPIRLFRLAKLILAYPEFTLESSLKGVLKRLNMAEVFKDFLTKTEAGAHLAARMSTAFDMLLDRFSTNDVMMVLSQLEILQTITGFESDKMDALIPICFHFRGRDCLFPGQSKERLFLVLSAHFLLKNGHEGFYDWPFYQVAKHVRNVARPFYQLLLNLTCDIPVNLLIVFPELDNMVDKVKSLHQQPRQGGTSP